MDEKQNISIRISKQSISDIKVVAARVHLPPSTMMGQWVLQRLDAEMAMGEQDV